MRAICMAFIVVVMTAAMAGLSTGTPQFAREYDMPCASCHSHVPKLNEFGEKFVAAGYSLPELKKKRSIPAALWISGLAQTRQDSSGRFTTIPNRIELISAGRDEARRLSYFIEWRMLSREVLADGSTRDRSGRFEDLFAIADLSPTLALQFGQFRALSQIDVSRRLNLSEPTVFSTSLAGEPHPDPRIASLRGFSASGRSPSARLAARSGAWNYALTVPFPGEFSIPLTGEAETTASWELESEPKGVFLEAFRRNGLDSIGVHVFRGNNRRTLVGAAAQVQTGRLSVEGGLARAEAAGAAEWRHSLWLDYISSFNSAFGVRWDHRQVASQQPQAFPYASLAWVKDKRLMKLHLEARLQKGALPRYAIELGLVF